MTLTNEEYRKWRASNRELVRATARRWAKRNPEQAREWRLANPEKRKEMQRRWRVKNPAKIREAAARYNARKRAAVVPLTADEENRIAALYAEAARRTVETGEEWEVDHDLPLKLGGKHHPDNLVVIPALMNKAKGANYPSTLAYILS